MAYTGGSIVDYLGSTGKDSSFGSRQKLYQQAGLQMGNYTGSAQQNTALLNALRGGGQVQGASTQQQSGQSLISQLGLLNPLPKTPTKPVATQPVAQTKVLGTSTLPQSLSTPPSYQSPEQQGRYAAPDFNDTIKRAQELLTQQLSPALSRLELQVPETQRVFASQRQSIEAQRAPLQQRYQNLIDELKGRTTRESEKQTRITSSELGKRGITGSSTLAQQEIANATRPIEEQGSAMLKDIALQGEEAQARLGSQLAGLSAQELDALRQVQGQIAQIQAGIAPQATSNALSQLQLQENARQFDLSRQPQPLTDLQRAQIGLINAQTQTTLKPPARAAQAMPELSLEDLFNAL